MNHPKTDAHLKNWSFRFEEEYLQSQTLFEPHPRGLEKDSERD
jgi:uncharacterized protein YbgA (DUF1722 family)